MALALEPDCVEEEDAPVTPPQKRPWVHDFLRGREQQGAFNNLVQELRLDDVGFKEYFRLSKSQFEHLLTMVAPAIQKMQTTFRESISPEERLCICLR